MHTVAVLALDGVLAFDLGTPLEVFGRTTVGGAPAYELVVAGPRRTVAAGPVSLSVPHGLDRLVVADTVVVPGRADPGVPPDPRAVRALQEAARRGARIASICVGALDLAAAGLLDGLRATTHWRAAAALATRFPAVDVDAGSLFVDNGQVLTSAGAAAGLDLCLHMIARDHGGAVAAEAARTAVVPLTREAGQAQYIRDDGLGSGGLTATLQWIEEHAAQPVTVADIARVSAVSARTLNRRFADEVGTTPSAWLTRSRVRLAQRLLETTDWSVERVAAASGLGSATNLRARFAAVVGTSPTRYRTALGTAPH
ncbi:GlxA family transcriptional regulator [Modestobacter roseus]|uniref:Transcriptional regulator GlxA family with amidase domain n=1 Tax=Modestobacter roseus TaxID=1181884 RepID=A0A562IPB2_9ACTN|nr:helix-turn-helix domain-containing protein [Modestobacter roseus]MQA35345.1 helix-turn-helix domain-containing protein [Modestobacter roseus]TWH72565.1 transcriptional regulator GlxA family with amidase domain [Modestobacter roseus]